MLLREKVIGRVKERHSHPDAKLGDLMVAHYKWQRGRKLGKPHPLDHTLYELCVHRGGTIWQGVRVLESNIW